MTSIFWEDLASDLEDPEFLKEYVTESLRIGTIDAIINALDEARQLEGLSKGDLARTIGSEPATIRRLLTARTPNPTIGTVIEVAAAVGLRITLERMPEEEQRAVTQPLRTGRPTAELKRRFVQERASRAKAKA